MAPIWSRRRLFRAVGGATAAPLLALTGCDDRTAPARRPAPAGRGGSVAYEAGSEPGQLGPVLRSQRPRPTPYVRPLPVPTPLRPVATTATEDVYDLTARPGTVRILDDVDTPVWGYDGSFPGPLFESHRGRSVRVRLRNELPVPTVRHLHGGHTPQESDGYPLDYVLPAGAAATGGEHHLHPGGRVHHGAFDYVYPLDQRAGLLWYHDHRMDFSGPQVWQGLVGLHVHRDDEEAALGLPDGDHEIPLLLCDRSFGPDGQLSYPSLDPDLASTPGVLPEFANGVLGDTVLVNGVHAPFHEVRQGTYRLRIAIASNARHYRIGLDRPPVAGEPFTMIGTDGGLMSHPMPVRSFVLAPAERVDVVLDLTGYPVGAKVRLQNLSGGSGTTALVEFRVTGPDDRPAWRPPARLSRIERLDPAAAVRTRSFFFSKVPTAGGPTFRISHHMFDPDRVAAAPRQGDIEIWELTTDQQHPVHVHNCHFQLLGDDGPLAWKDVVSLGVNDRRRIITRFDSYRGRFLLHCHNLEHEDMGMMANYEIR